MTTRNVAIVMSKADLAVAESTGLDLADWLRWMYDQHRLKITPGENGGPPLVEILSTEA